MTMIHTGIPRTPNKELFVFGGSRTFQGEAYRRAIANIDEAVLLINSLGEYDHFLLEMNLRRDHPSMDGLEVFDDDEWIEWESEDGSDIVDFAEDRERNS